MNRARHTKVHNSIHSGVYVDDTNQMVLFDNNDLLQIVLDRLRKDRKGSINPEEFESLLRLRNIDYFNQQ